MTKLYNGLIPNETPKTKKGKTFNYRVVHPYREKINPQDDFVDIEVEFHGKKYRGSVTTKRFIDERLNYYKKSGENAGGSYFCAEGMIIVRRIDDKTIRKTLEDLIERGNLPKFLNH